MPRHHGRNMGTGPIRIAVNFKTSPRNQTRPKPSIGLEEPSTRDRKISRFQSFDRPSV